MEEFRVYGVALVPVIMGMVQLLKKSGMPKKYSPLASITLGILSGLFYMAPDDPRKAIFLGIVVGLTSVGLYSGTKNTMEEMSYNKGEKLLHKNRKMSSPKKNRLKQANK